MYSNINQIDWVLETKKNFIYEKDYRSKFITVYTTLSLHETVDQKLQQMKWKDGHTKYLSFRNSTPQMRLSALYLNSMNNVSVKYEYLKNCSVYNEVKYNGKVGILK